MLKGEFISFSKFEAVGGTFWTPRILYFIAIPVSVYKGGWSRSSSSAWQQLGERWLVRVGGGVMAALLFGGWD